MTREPSTRSTRARRRPGTVVVFAALLACAPASRVSSQATSDGREVRTTILPGEPPAPPPPPPPVRVLAGGAISLNFPSVDVQAVAKAILGDTLHVPFAVDPQVHGAVTVQTARPIRRADVLTVFEQALTASGLVLADRAGVYTILPAAAARGEAPAAISVADPNANVMVISGTAAQRRALRELVAEFDVDWLRGMSFALFIPERTDARLIAPELDKLLNAPGTPSAGLVRLIAMDRLNGILAITAQPRYLDDARRFVEILDREGEGAERRMFVYRVQNGRAADLTKVLDAAFGFAAPVSSPGAVDPTQIVDRTPGAVPPTMPTLLPNGTVVALPARVPATVAETGRSPGQGPQSSSDVDAVTITADEANNAIVVFSSPRNYALIEDALRKLDVPPLQVMIDASISEVTLNHTLQYGLQWAFQAGRLGGILSQGVQTTTTNPTTGLVTTTNPGPQQT